jgi:hypothetical protein
MHEVKLGFKIKDYLSGKEIDATTYEDLRQNIVQMMVEEKGYPKENIRAKVLIAFEINGKKFSRTIDFAIYFKEFPILIVIFCAGEIETYVRESLALARLIENGPASFALVTDTQKFILASTKDGEILLQKDYKDFPLWRDILKLKQKYPAFLIDAEKKQKEERILYALSQISCECRDSCNL